jgi:DNA/RNA-binding protein KIN17
MVSLGLALNIDNNAYSPNFIQGKRAEVGTPKYLANAMKSKGLQRLRWYCQVCQKQCRDENGFKCHTQSEGHLRQMLVVGESAGKHIQDYSMQFQSEFVALLSRRLVSP